MCDQILKIIIAFLTDRTFQVRIGQAFSPPCPVPSGIPQVSVLGPLLFLMFINDLPNRITSFCSLFADDLKLVAASQDSARTQLDLNRLDAWQRTWLLTFNTADEKCKVLHIGPSTTPTYFMNAPPYPHYL